VGEVTAPAPLPSWPEAALREINKARRFWDLDDADTILRDVDRILAKHGVSLGAKPVLPPVSHDDAAYHNGGQTYRDMLVAQGIGRLPEEER
jgi:hypothetical protein